MSTMLKSAAMSLLSKTLQTFLSKYLSDVDVEGVALPSLYDGYSSGWGARLSNLKLREGVQLLAETPGKMKKRRKRTKPKAGKSPMHTPTKTSPRHANEKVNNNPRSSSIDQSNISQMALAMNGEESPESPEYEELKDKTSSDPRSSKPLDVDYYTDDEESVEGIDKRQPVQSDNPQKPNAKKRGLFSCFVKNPQYMKPPPPPPPPPKKESSESSSEDNEEWREKNNTVLSMQSEPGEELGNASVVSSPLEEFSTTGDSADPVVDKPFARSKIRPDDTFDDGTEEEEEYEEYEQPMMLRLGEGGRIGTLDARLVEKDLHILVEDAFLTIEAIPVPEYSESDDGDGDDDGSDEDGAEKLDDFKKLQKSFSSDVKTPKQGPKVTPSKTKQKPVEKQRATVGDRVLQDIPLARLLSAVPHLFLRDVRIRIIIRAEASEETLPPDFAGPNDTVIEIGVDFFSVSSDEDALSKFQTEEEPLSNDVEDLNSRAPMRSIPSFQSENSMREDQNEFMYRHMRTGRGPEGGFWLKAFAPHSQAMGAPASLGKQNDSHKWARSVWLMETNYHLFRLSGLDVRARIYLGPKKEVDTFSWFYGYDDEAEDYDSGLDSMFWGVDHVAPGPSLPMPPLMSRGDTPRKERVYSDFNEEIRSPPSGQSLSQQELINIIRSADDYSTDKNGIQSCSVESNFHRVGRGLTPGPCRNCCHLPSEDCKHCWESTLDNDRGSSLDSSLPMPGLVLQIITRDPIEINADRDSLLCLGVLQSLLRRAPEEASSDADDADGNESKVEEAEKETPASSSVAPNHQTPADDGTSRTSTTSFFSAFTSRRATEEPPKEEKSEAFPIYMQPETIQIVGIHLTSMTVRFHAMHSNRETETASRFCFWEIKTSCLNIDKQQHISDQVSYNDLRVEIGHLTWKEFAGVERSVLLSLGMLPSSVRSRCDSTASFAISPDQKLGQGASWPSTACALLAIPPPLETLDYSNRNLHGLQSRLKSVGKPENSAEPMRSNVNVRLGCTKIDMPWSKRSEIATVRSSAFAALFGKARETKRADVEVPNSSDNRVSATTSAQDNPPQQLPKSLMYYNVQIENSSVRLPPLINMKAPVTRFVGQRSSEAGLSIESVLNKLQFSYGEEDTSMSVKTRCLSIAQVGKLPEVVRMRIFMFMDNMHDLGEALELQKEKNAFQQFKSIDREIVRRAEILSEAQKAEGLLDRASRRQKMLDKLTNLHDDELEKLLVSLDKK